MAMIEPMTYVIPVQCSDLPTKLSKQLTCMQPVTLTQGRIKRKGAGGAQPPLPPPLEMKPSSSNWLLKSVYLTGQ